MGSSLVTRVWWDQFRTLLCEKIIPKNIKSLSGHNISFFEIAIDLSALEHHTYIQKNSVFPTKNPNIVEGRGRGGCFKF